MRCMHVCVYVKIRRHQHTRVHAHTGPSHVGLAPSISIYIIYWILMPFCRAPRSIGLIFLSIYTALCLCFFFALIVIIDLSTLYERYTTSYDLYTIDNSY